MKLLNAFSANMLDPSIESINVEFHKLTLRGARDIVENYGIESCIGHADTANLLSNMLDTKIETNRCTVSMAHNEHAILCQYRGERLTEGCTTLPENSTITFFLITIK